MAAGTTSALLFAADSPGTEASPSALATFLERITFMVTDPCMKPIKLCMNSWRDSEVCFVAVADLVRYRLRTERLVEKMVDTQTDLGNLGSFRVQIFRSMTDNKLHVALSKATSKPRERPSSVLSALGLCLKAI